MKLVLLSFVLVKVGALQPKGAARFFLDSADRADWEEMLPTGLFHGVTTNPTLLERAGVSCDLKTVSNLAMDAIDAGVEEVMVQSWGGTTQLFESNALGLLDACPSPEKLVIKLPLTRSGIVAAKSLLARDVKVCMTACYGRHQALTAGALSASYVAPYLGRMTDLGKDGLEECVEMEGTLRAMRSPTRVLVASLRDVETLFEVIAVGSDATFSPEVARALVTYEPTEIAAKEFERAAGASQPLDVEEA